MTLLESIVAFVVLALVGIACLDLSRGAVQLQRSSAEWTEAVRVGEAALAAASLGDEPLPDAKDPAGAATRGMTIGARSPSTPAVASVSRRSWRSDRAVEVVEVTVPLPGGGTYRVQRLVRRPVNRARVATSLPRSEMERTR